MQMSWLHQLSCCRALGAATGRIQGLTATATATATVQLHHSAKMRDGDRAGLAPLRDSSAWIGIKRQGGAMRVVMVSGLTMDSNWNTAGTGHELASEDRSGQPHLAARQRGHPPLRGTPGLSPAASTASRSPASDPTFSRATTGGCSGATGSPSSTTPPRRSAARSASHGSSCPRPAPSRPPAAPAATDRTRRNMNPLKRPGRRRVSVLGLLDATVLMAPGAATGSPDAVQASTLGAKPPRQDGEHGQGLYDKAV